MMHEELWSQVIKLEPAATAKRAKCKYQSDTSCFAVIFLGSEYIVDIAKKDIFLADRNKPAEYLKQLCILAYLINSCQIPVANKLVNPNKLDGGQFFFHGPHALPLQELAEVFGQKPGLLYQASSRFNAKKCDYGDASVEIFALPRLPLYYVIWAGDEEFPARISILFDQTASKQLPLDALWAVVKLMNKALIESCS